MNFKIDDYPDLRDAISNSPAGLRADADLRRLVNEAYCKGAESLIACLEIEINKLRGK